MNDFANVIDDDVEAQLDDALRLAEQETSVEIVAVTVEDLGGDTIEGYAVRLFEQWGVGKSGEDNGVLLIAAVAEREVRIEVGYGLEGVITDGRAGRILDEQVLPELRLDNYTLGILNGLYEIRLILEDAGYSSPDGRDASSPDEGDGGLFGFIVDHLWLTILLTVVSTYMFGYMARTRSVAAGAVWGCMVGGVVGWMMSGVLGMVLGAIAGLVLGLLLDAMLSTAYAGQAGSGASTSWHTTWGGFGGMGGGWKSGGARFPGFGGGRSGGGGARRRF